jgi:RNA polymerase sigma factor (sigma-70 family)
MTSTEPPTTQSDAGRCDDGPDVDAFWRAHGVAALRYATVLVGPDHAHDITVDAFLRVTRSDDWASIRNPRAYLIRAITNQAHDHRRQQARRWRRDLAALAPTTTPGPESNVDIHRQIAQLSVQQRAVVFLAYWEDMTEPAIAALLGLSTGTVHRNLSRARARLRKALQ